MRWMICSLTLLSLALWTAPMIGCCKRGAPVEPRVVTVRERCLRQPPPPTPDLTTWCDPAKVDVRDCLAFEIVVRDRWIAAALAACGVKP